jgi:uncharacterized protein YciI
MKGTKGMKGMIVVLALGIGLCSHARDAPGLESAQADVRMSLFAIEFTTGPTWVADKPANEQRYFREHSANLQALRESGALVVGARYGDTGLVIVEAVSIAAARTLVERDPSIAAGTFRYEVHPLSVFYGGALHPPEAGRARE